MKKFKNIKKKKKKFNLFQLKMNLFMNNKNNYYKIN